MDKKAKDEPDGFLAFVEDDTEKKEKELRIKIFRPTSKVLDRYREWNVGVKIGTVPITIVEEK